VEAAGRPRIDASVAHSARVHDYWLGGKDNFAADRAAGDAVQAAYPGIVQSVRANRAFRQYNQRARETQRHRTHAEVARFFDGLELLEPGVVVVPQWRPQSRAEAEAHSGMWGGVGRRA
jgi:hypothetical protein